MQQIVGVVGSVPFGDGFRNDDDFADRLSHRYTVAILIVSAIIVSTKQYVGDPINCWVPAHFTGNHEEYANNYCWIRNTYYLPFEEYIPRESEGHLRDMIPYYQWVPIILLVSALMFYLPIMVWRSLNTRAGIDVNNIVEAAETFQNTEKADSRDTTMLYMTKQMDRYLLSQEKRAEKFTCGLKNAAARMCCFCCGKQHGNYLVTLYIFIKILFAINVIGQLFALNFFLDMDFNVYGFEVLKAAISGEDWFQTKRFPRVTMCDLKVRRLGNLQRYTVQCVLPINLFNEAIFLFIWFWMVFVATLTAISFLSWLMKAMIPTDGKRYVRKHLTLMDRLEQEPDMDTASMIERKNNESGKKQADKFVDKYLKPDGVFILRLIGKNTNAITVTEFICSLWDNYRKDEATTEEQ